MEAIVAWFIYLSLQFLELCNCYPVTPLADGSPPGFELGSLLPSLLATATIFTVLLLLVGCSWCTAIFKKDARISQPIQLGETGSSQVVDPGILNPLNDIRFPITTPINHHSTSSRGHQQQSNPRDENELPLRTSFYPREQHDVDNNNLFEDNNNGPISPQELENIVNNNAENYIVTQYENRNLNQVQREVVEDVAVASTSSSTRTSPRHNVWAQYSDWFYNASEDFPRAQLQYLQVIGKGWFGRIVEGEAHNLERNASPQCSDVTRVAVKILDENVSVADKCSFLQESQILRDANHESILKFTGKNLAQDPWFILLEYCPLGDLKQYLITNKFQMQSLNDQGIPLRFIVEITSALHYLCEKNIYQYVACHGCLVTEGPSVRLGDYGDAEQRYPQHFCSLQGSKPLPVRWLPPEYVNVPQATHGGTMWSLGIFMWECCCWGALPYDNLSNEQVIQSVLCGVTSLNGVRLQQPVPNSQYTSYLYNVMQTCWNDDPKLRGNLAQVFEYLQSLYGKFYHPYSGIDMDESFTHNFNARWETLKPNYIPKVDNSLPECSPQLEDNYYNLNFTRGGDIIMEPDIRVIHPSGELSYQNLAISTDTISLEEVTLKVKSDSLTNLHGSFESVSMRENMENSQESEQCFVVDDAVVEKCLLKSAVPHVAPWLLDVPFKTPEDICYIKNVSDVMSDFDNMLSSEKTSSSESSPSRDVVTHTSEIACEELILSQDVDKTSLDNSVTEINNCFKECQSQQSAYETNVICSESVNNSLNNVPETCKVNIKHTHPTLDFRIMQTNDQTSLVHPMFETNTAVNTQELDSLQDSSYTPGVNRDKDNSSRKRSTSGSETEDEVWKKRIELGFITEKIKMKSKSVTDFMVLTHIDMDLTDMESEHTSYNSLEGRSNTFHDIVHRRLLRNSSQHETNLYTDECYSSFHRNSSSLNHFTSLRPELDLYKLWRNCKNITLKNLRPTKSLSELNVSSPKIVPFEDLVSFKKKMDSFLVFTAVKDHNNDVIPIESRHFNLTDPCHLPVGSTSHIMFSQRGLNMVENFLNVDAEEENLKFSSNFNDININLYTDERIVDETSANQNSSEEWESTKYINLPEQFSLGNVSNEPSTGDNVNVETCDAGKINELPSTSVDIREENNIKTSTPNRELLIPSVSISEVNSDNPIPIPNGASLNSLVERQIDEIIRTEMLNITTKLAIAENENNLNIELSSPPNNVEDSQDYYGELENDVDENKVIVEASNMDIEIPSISVDSKHSFSVQDTLNSNHNEDSETTPDNYGGAVMEYSGGAIESSQVIPDMDINNRNVEAINEIMCVRDKAISNQLIQDLDSELEKLDAACEIAEANYFSPETSESLYDNVDPNYRKDPTSSSGWYLHPKAEISSDVEDVIPQVNAFPINLSSSNCSSVESLTENTNSDHYTVDPESVEALRNELHLKLPLAQRVTQMHHDNLASNILADSNDWANTESPLPMCKPSVRDVNIPKHSMVEASTSTGTSTDIPAPIHAQAKNEVMIHYSMYGIVPLSPIQEESWSEFSEMEKAADIDKTDASNSLSLGEQTSNIEQVLPFDGVCDMMALEIPTKHNDGNEIIRDDDTYSDCSNRTFVLNEGGPSNLKRQESLSADSLNSIEQFDIDEGEVPVQRNQLGVNVKVPQLVTHPAKELYSPFCDEHSHPKSTEEISQNVDNLLETISKTLENASKIVTCCDQVDLSNGNDIDISDDENSGSKTYVIENKIHGVEDLNAVYNDKVAEIAEDISNVSKVSQPSFMSQVTSPEGSDMKLSDKSLSLHTHTKTLSMDSWCSNDTLFNVEENFDDAFDGDLTPLGLGVFEQPPMEVVMGCSENVINCSLQEDNEILSVFQQIDKSPPDKLEISKHFPISLPGPLESSDVLVGSADENIMDKNIIVESDMSGALKDVSNCNLPSIVIQNSPINSNYVERNKSEGEVPASCTETCNDNSKCQSGGTDNSAVNLSTVTNSVYKNNFQSCKMNMTSTPTSCVLQETSVNNTVDHLIDDQFKFLEKLNLGVISDDIKDESSLVLQVTNSFLQNEQKFAHSLSDRSTSSKNTKTTIPLMKSLEGNSVSSELSIINISDDNVNTDASNVAENINICSETVDNKHSTGLNSLSPPDVSNVTRLSVESTHIQDHHAEDTSTCTPPEVEGSSCTMYSTTGIRNEKTSSSIPETNVLIDNDATPDSVNCLVTINVSTNSYKLENEDIPDYKSNKYLDLTNPALTEYMESTGLNMGLVNLDEAKNYNSEDSPSFEVFKQSAGALPQDLENIENQYNLNVMEELYSTGLQNIHFSGPLKDDLMSTSFNETSSLKETSDQIHREIGHLAPERLKDWDSGSDDSNCSSTSSAEFVWKEGDGAQLLNLPSISYPSFGMMKQQSSHGASQSFADIPEETEDGERGEDDEEEEDEEEVEFVPSSWDCHAAPSKSALKSPDTSQIETRKRVVFKKQKYQSIYEYPRDDENFQTLPDFSTYAEWNATNSSDYMPVEYHHFTSSNMSESPTLSGSGIEDDFFISSSSRPFEPYSTLNSSQFFPGQQFSLLTNQNIYGEILDNNEDDDFESLPPIPTEQELEQALGDDINIVHSDTNSMKKSSDYITPDSGTEDTSPGDLLDFEDILNNKNLSTLPEVTGSVDEGVDNDIENNTDAKKCSDKLTISPPVTSSSTSSLGGLRHTRDKLKLDLPPSPLPRNSPCIVNSGKNSNKDVRIFDFKNIDQLESEETETVTVTSVAQQSPVVEDESKKDREKCLSSLESDTCDSDVISPNSVISVIAADNEQQTKESGSSLPVEGDVATLHKSVIRMQDKTRRVSLEPVKGEGTLLDSGDEDSGIGSSAYATLERKCDDIQSHPVLVKNTKPM